MQPLLLVLALCVAQICALPPGSPNDYNDEFDNEDTNVPWQPEPLKPAPWQEEPQVQEPQVVEVEVPGIGNIVGVKAFRTNVRRPVNAFLGLRYGQVGNGLARFQAARPAGFQGRINATVPSPNCAQFPELDRLRTAESRGENVDDCLTLDIYAPENANRLPVLVFVHGEMLFDGGAEEGQPDYILERDVLLVSINYRLAPFGFLSALSNELPGNVALSDLHLALEWLHRNLPYFGGDPGKVTLVGQAGGATLAHALSLSGRAKDLFQQLILQSGTALNPYLIDERPLETLDTFARLARCPPATPSARGLQPLYACIARLPTSQLVAAFEQLLQQNERLGLSHIGGFKLVVGDPLGYLPRPPAQLVANVSNALPMIIGATKDAGAFILSRIYDQIVSLRSYNVSDYIDVVLRHTAPPSEHRMWKQFALREIFLTDQERSATPDSVSQGLLELSNYILYRAPVINSIRHSYRSVPAYLYLFDYRGQHHRFFHLRNPLPFGVDASLSDDGVYLFPYPPESSHLNSVDSSVSNSLVNKWVDFAVAGVPNQNSGGWPRASSEYGPCLRFTNSIPLLELDPHFGESLNLPNLSGESFKPTTTTTTTTRRPYAYNWTSRPNQQPPLWNPSNSEYVKDQEAQQQQFIRDRAQRWKEQQQREQEERERQRQQREQEERGRQRQQREQEERERQQQQQQREQEERQRQQREQEERRRQRQQREQEERERQQQQREQVEPERARQYREEAERVRQQQELEQQEREQKEREQQEREQTEREQQERERQEQYEQELEPQPEDNPEQERQEREQQEQERQEREQQEREQQEREQQEPEQQEREQQEREQQEREQQEREQQEREQQERDQQDRDRQEGARQDRDQQERDRQDREQREREQQEREQQKLDEQERERQEQEPQEPEFNPEDPSYDVYPSDPEPDRNYNEEEEHEEQQREQLRREQQEQRDREDQLQREREREQQERVREDQPKDKPEDYPSYEEYLKAQEETNSERDRNYDEEQERERQQQEQLHQERHPHPEGNLPETHYSDSNYAEEEERDQQAGEDQGVNRNTYSGNEELERSQDEETDQDALNPADFENYEAYILAATKQQQEREEQYRLEDERIRAQQEAEFRLGADPEEEEIFAT